MAMRFAILSPKYVDQTHNNYAYIKTNTNRRSINMAMDNVSDWDIIAIIDREIPEDEIERHNAIYEKYPEVETVKGNIITYKNIYRQRNVKDPQQDIFERLIGVVI